MVKKSSGLLGGIREKSEKLKKEENSREVTVASLEKIKIRHKHNLNLCDDEKINELLNEKSDKLYFNEVNSNIIAGEILTEVYSELSGNNRYDGLYLEWLKAIDYSARTALRHRVRYAFFKLAKTEVSKELFATLPVKLLEKLHSSENREFLIASVNNGEISSKVELEDMLISLPAKENPNDSVLIPIQFANEYKTFMKKAKNIDLTKLTEKDIEKVHKLIESFNKIIEKSETVGK